MDTAGYSQFSHRDFALSVCASLRRDLGVDLVPLLTAPSDLPDRQRVKNAAVALMEAILNRAHALGLDDLLVDPQDPRDDPVISALMTDAVELEPNFAVSETDARYLMQLQGASVREYITTLTKRFENMSKAPNIGILVAEMAGGAIIGVGVPAVVGTVKALRAGEALMAAMRTGITSIGMKTVIGVVVLVLAGLLYFLLWENPKKVLGLLLNDTEENFVVKNWRDAGGDLFMQHGQMVNFMQDNEDGLQSPTVQLKQKLSFGPSDPDNVVFAGLYFADRNIGFRGSEGVMVFSSTTSDLMFAHMFASPYVNDNGTNMRYLNQRPTNLEGLYRELYDSRQVRVDLTSNGYRFTSTVNDPRGGIVSCIASVSGPM